MRRRRNGFTLVELVIAVGVMAILAMLAVIVVSNIRVTAREVTAKSNAQAVIRAVNTYNSLTSSARVNAITVSADDLGKLALSAEDAGGLPLHLGINLNAEELVFARNYIWYVDEVSFNLAEGFKFRE